MGPQGILRLVIDDPRLHSYDPEFEIKNVRNTLYTEVVDTASNVVYRVTVQRLN